MADLRSALEEAFDATNDKEEQVSEPTEVAEPEVEVEVEAVAESPEEPQRDEKGRFVSKEDQAVEAVEHSVEDDAEVEEPTELKPALARPTTWKKEYLPIWDKLTTGQQLTPEEALKLAEYSNQRESEYKKGVSAYKAEADNSRQLREAIEPFIPELQKNGIHPAAWINNLGRAHLILAQGTPEQKVQMFHRLAQDYGVQLNATGEVQQLDPYTQQLQYQLQQLNQEVSAVKGWREQQENARLMEEINRVSSNAEKFPHFEAVRETMAQLLEHGQAQDLETAYAKAVRLQDDVWQLEQERLLKQATQKVSQAQKVAKAKAAAVSPKSVTPSGVATTSDKKDRRSILAEQLGEMNSRV